MIRCSIRRLSTCRIAVGGHRPDRLTNARGIALPNHLRFLTPNHHPAGVIRQTALRSFSNQENSSNKPPKDGEETQALVLTPGQKVVAAGRITMWAGIFAFASVCAYYIGRELIPTYVIG